MKKTLLLTIFSAYFFHQNALCQLDTLFWFVAPEVTSSHGDRPIVFRFNAMNEPAEIEISQPANPNFPVQNISLLANESQTLNLLPWILSVENAPSNTVLTNGFKIVSTTQITAYYEVTPTCQCNPDIMSLKGRNALGTSFVIPGQTFYSNDANYNPRADAKFDIVATEDNTTVTIIPENNIFGHSAGVPFTITLDEGETYSAVSVSQSAAFKVVGSIVTSDKPIAITYSDDSVMFNQCRDIISDQIIPTGLIGTDYIAVKGFLQGVDRVFVTATDNGTDVFVNGNATPVATLNFGETHMISLADPSVFIQTSEPAYVFHVTGFGCEVGGAILPPIVCTGSFEVPFVRSTSELFGLTLLIKSGFEGDFLLDGQTGIIAANQFNTVPGTNGEWMYAQIDLSASIIVGQGVRVENPERFHLGLINGGASSGCRFGFFSDFSSFQYDIEQPALAICEGGDVSFGTNPAPGATYNWIGPNGFVSEGPDVSLTNLTLDQAGYYVVSGTLPQACELQPDSIFIEVGPIPTISSFSSTYLCDGSSAALTYQVDWNGSQAGTVVVSPGNGDVLNNPAETFVAVYSNPGTSQAQVTAISPLGCQATETFDVDISQVPLVGVSTSSLCTSTITFNADITQGISFETIENTFWLINSDSISNNTDLVFDVQQEDGNYPGTFGIVTNLGCVYTYAFNYDVDNRIEGLEFELPNVITPNNDGENEAFLVNFDFDFCVPYELVFLNRWGQVVFTTNSNSNPFKGIGENGVLLPTGVYFYKLSSDLFEKHGFVHVKY